MEVNYRRWKRLPLFLIIVILLVTPLYGCARQQSPYPSEEKSSHVQITGCYSNLFQHEDTGDILGRELFLVYSDCGYQVLYQESEGWPRVLLLLPVSVDGNTIRFTIPRDHGKRHDTFQGKVTADKLSGTFSTGEKIILPRKKSFWQ